METTIDINHIFPERITVLDQNLIASRKSSGRSDPQPQIAAVIDELGRASAKAQHLTAPITSASKLQTNKHHLYLIKDGESKGGKGLVVGFLKVGYKKLFLLDQRGAHVETEPLCVLDFFVKEDLQRHGYGLELFEFMLQHKKVDPVMMAFDRPSPKFLSFLEKHYCLKNSVPQVNNFVVFDGFFANRSAVRSRKVPPKKPDGEIKPYSLTEREALREEQRALPWPMSRPAPPPPSPPLSGSSLCSPNRGRQRPDPALAPALANAPGGYRSPTLRSPLTDSLHSREKRTSQQGLVARSNLYSRHTNTRGVGLQLNTPLNPQMNTVKLPDLCISLCRRCPGRSCFPPPWPSENQADRPTRTPGLGGGLG
ncbi:alpha-tubulin N-acetyltransferase 1 isoform X4 [Esox lucius]|uniref:Alpha-tubulin N-acetyltransferase 1 n=1 Tax=Esox lucius TaxID=8010 RepID=A0A3P8YS58_ESOLU|nr:alpha-tubulin N-acetyltransferase 1 isoform X4 [Esox lucius]